MAKGEKRLRSIWHGMKRRCESPKDKCYKHYGGRGITVCEAWHDFEVFKSWALKNGYKDDLSIDRIDNNQGYYPANCRWATNEEQANNHRNNFRIKAFGLDLTSNQWSRLLDIDRKTLRLRLASGMTPEEAVTHPIMKNGEVYRKLNPIPNVDTDNAFSEYVLKSLKHFGMTREDLGERIGITRKTIYSHITGQTKWKPKDKDKIYRLFSKLMFIENDTKNRKESKWDDTKTN